MRTFFSLAIAALLLTGLSACGGGIPVTVQGPLQIQLVPANQPVQPINQPMTFSPYSGQTIIGDPSLGYPDQPVIYEPPPAVKVQMPVNPVAEACKNLRPGTDVFADCAAVAKYEAMKKAAAKANPPPKPAGPKEAMVAP